MIIARVIGNVVATQKNERYASARVMLCQPLTLEGAETGLTLLALDSVDAGIGDVVLIVQEGWGASTAATGKAGAAIDSAIVGVVDRIDLLPEDAELVEAEVAADDADDAHVGEKAGGEREVRGRAAEHPLAPAERGLDRVERDRADD